jgi:hypothetical protein
MKRIGFCLVVLAIHGLCRADVTKLTTEHRKVLENSARFGEVHAVADLPPGIVALCADDNGKLADPGQTWEATDVVGPDSPFPRKRLIWAAVSGDYYVVHYERGGIAHSFHILVATVSKADSKPKIVWRAVGSHLENYSEFVRALRSGKLDDRLDYAH